MQNQYFFYRTEGSLKQIDLDEVIYLEATDNYTKFYTSKDAHFMVRVTLENCMNLLPKNTFLRIHRSFAIAGQYAVIIKRDTALLSAIKKELPVSKQYYSSLLKQIVVLQNRAAKRRKPEY
jgi:DNA-binding LytR/AlgR family response regulator